MKYDSEQDQRVHEMSLDFPTYEEGSVETCEWNAFIGLTSAEVGALGHDEQGQAYMAAIVTESGQGFVSVDYFTGRHTGAIVWRELVNGHRYCCGDISGDLAA